MKVYFCGSITGGRSDVGIYSSIIEMIEEEAEVLSEHVGQEDLGSDGEDASKQEVHDRDVAWLRESDFVIAEVTVPSLGVGYELAKAAEMDKPVLCLYREGKGKTLSGMIEGNEDFEVHKYRKVDALEDRIQNFLADS